VEKSHDEIEREFDKTLQDLISRLKDPNREQEVGVGWDDEDFEITLYFDRRRNPIYDELQIMLGSEVCVTYALWDCVIVMVEFLNFDREFMGRPDLVKLLDEIKASAEHPETWRPLTRKLALGILEQFSEEGS
jgi:hypothetical protein